MWQQQLLQRLGDAAHTMCCCRAECDVMECTGGRSCYMFASKEGPIPDGTRRFPQVCLDTPPVSDATAALAVMAASGCDHGSEAAHGSSVPALCPLHWPQVAAAEHSVILSMRLQWLPSAAACCKTCSSCTCSVTHDGHAYVHACLFACRGVARPGSRAATAATPQQRQSAAGLA
jgi:hypothetical protein